MKHLVTLIVAIALFSTGAWAQCTPTIPANSDPGLYPPDSTLACIERTVAYSEVIEFKNFEDVDATSFGFPGVTATVDSIRIDSIFDVPTGLTTAFNNASRVYVGGEIGCILLSGNTSDAAGTVVLEFEATVWAKAFGFAVPAQSLSRSQLADLGLTYDLEIIEPGAACRGVAPGAFNASITGANSACTGDSVTLTLVTDAAAPYSAVWSTGAVTNIIKVAAPAAISVTVTDVNSVSVIATKIVNEDLVPTADFTPAATATPGEVTITNSSSDATAYSWDFAGLGTDTSATPTYTFTENGEYDITLIAVNDCGSDTTVESVTISGIVGINELGSIFNSVQIAPNPSNGNFNLRLVANETSPVSVKVFNLQGQAVYTNVLNVVAGQASTQAIQLGNAASGIYIIQVQANDALITQKLIIK